MTVIPFPASGLTESDYQALQGEGYRRLEQGRAGYVTRGYNTRGQMWAVLRRHPNGPPVHHFCRDQGIYYVLYFDESGESRLVDAHRDFTEILSNLPDRPAVLSQRPGGRS